MKSAAKLTALSSFLLTFLFVLVSTAETATELLPAGEAADVAERSVAPVDVTFAPGKGLSVKSEDGDFKLTTALRAQFLYTLEKEETAPGSFADASQSFEIRRARLKFTGNLFGKNNKFKTEFAFSERDLGVGDTVNGRAPQTSPILDWYMDFNHLRDLQLRVGQYKVPFNRQRVISSGDLQLVDRSIVNAELNLDRDIGIDFNSDDLGGLDLLKYHLGVYTGEGRNSNNASDFGMFYLARLEVLPMGDFEDYKEADLQRYATPKLSLGAAYAYLDRARFNEGTIGSVPEDGGTTDIHTAVVDAFFKFRGLSVFTESILRDGQRNPGSLIVIDEDTGEETPIPAEPPLNGYGTMLQAGYLLPQTRLELVARAGFVRRLNDESAFVNDNELGGGLSYYFAHHSFKLQADYFYYQTGNDEVLDAHVARVQLQTSL